MCNVVEQGSRRSDGHDFSDESLSGALLSAYAAPMTLWSCTAGWRPLPLCYPSPVALVFEEGTVHGRATGPETVQTQHCRGYRRAWPEPPIYTHSTICHVAAPAHPEAQVPFHTRRALSKRSTPSVELGSSSRRRTRRPGLLPSMLHVFRLSSSLLSGMCGSLLQSHSNVIYAAAEHYPAGACEALDFASRESF